MKKLLQTLFATVFLVTNSGPMLVAPVYAKGRAVGKAKTNIVTKVEIQHDDNDGEGHKDVDDDGDRDDDREKHEGGKITLCHIPPGNPTARHSLKVGAAAVNAHLAHGDLLGECKKVDIKTPGITKVSVSTTATGAIVMWRTNEPSTGKVRYATGSLSTATNIQFVADATFTKEHGLTITGLQSATKYFFQIVSQDIAGNISSLAEMTFTTQAAAPDATPPVISGITTTAITTTSAKISWTTDEPSSSIVKYAVAPLASAASIFTVLDNARVTSHLMMLSGLTASTTYHFRVKSVDASGNVTTAAEMTFATPAAPSVDDTAPVISGLMATSTTQTASSIKWSTNEPSNSRVEYATSPLAGASTILVAANSTNVTAHLVPLSGLTASTTYHFRVKSTDAAGNTATSAEMMFTTHAAADATAPLISGLTATSTTSSGTTVQWSTDEPSNSRVIFAKQSLATATTVWSVFSSMLTGMHDIMLSGLSAATQYFFRVESTDAAGNTTTSVEQSFTTQP